MGEHYEILFPDEEDQDDDVEGGRDVRESRGKGVGAKVDDDDDDDAVTQGLDDPFRKYKVVQGVDDGQVDLNLWPDHCVSPPRNRLHIPSVDPRPSRADHQTPGFVYGLLDFVTGTISGSEHPRCRA